MFKKDIKPKDEQGNPHGLWVVYHHNGNLFYRGTYIHGNFYGFYYHYYQNGKLYCKGNYFESKDIGWWFYFKENGEFDGSYYSYYDKEIHFTSKSKMIL